MKLSGFAQARNIARIVSILPFAWRATMFRLSIPDAATRCVSQPTLGCVAKLDSAGAFLTMEQDGDVKRWYFRDRDGDARRSRLGIRLIYGGDNAVHGPENIDFSMQRIVGPWLEKIAALFHSLSAYRASDLTPRFNSLSLSNYRGAFWFPFISQHFPCITDLVKHKKKAFTFWPELLSF